MSNSRSFRRSLRADHHVRPSGQEQQQDSQHPKGRVPWNKGRVLTTRPTLDTVRRWIRECADEGWIERKGTERTGKPGRPATLWGLTEAGAELRRKEKPVPPEVAKMQTRQLRRWENAKQRGRAQRAVQERNRLQGRVDRAGRKLTAATAALADAERAEAALTLAAEMVTHATEVLLSGTKDTPAELHPEEVDALLEYRCAYRADEGQLVLNANWLEEFGRITSPA